MPFQYSRKLWEICSTGTKYSAEYYTWEKGLVLGKLRCWGREKICITRSAYRWCIPGSNYIPFEPLDPNVKYGQAEISPPREHHVGCPHNHWVLQCNHSLWQQAKGMQSESAESHPVLFQNPQKAVASGKPRTSSNNLERTTYKHRYIAEN